MVTSVAPGGQVESDWTFHRGGGEGLAAACSLGLVVGFMFGKNFGDPRWSLVWIIPAGRGLDRRAVLDLLLGHAS